MIPVDPEAYQLMHQGAIALAEVEATGMRIDVPYLKRTIDKVGKRIDQQTEKLKQDEVWQVWEKKFGREANLGSRPQLGQILFGELEYKSKSKTPTGRFSTDADTLEKLDIPFVKKLLGVEDLKHLRNTYLRGILREVVDGLLHPSFNLHLVQTYRSSCNNPNFQNIPIRDPRIGKLIRRAFIPREGRMLVEIDYSQIEVRCAACYHFDPTMIEYINDPAKDMHRDAAAECFLLEQNDVTKATRNLAKNQFTFPEFYGSYFVDVAKGLWEGIDSFSATRKDGVGLREHLAEHGIEKLGAADGLVGYKASGRIRTSEGGFMEHIRKIEKHFWEVRFPVYDQWKRDWWEEYLRKGWSKTLTGFLLQGVYRRNQVINQPVQGVAFHCLLWSLIRMVDWLRESGLKSRVTGQIHDSLVLDVVKSELEDVVAGARCIMVEELRRAWPWIIVPLEIEVEGSEVNWWEKKELAV